MRAAHRRPGRRAGRRAGQRRRAHHRSRRSSLIVLQARQLAWRAFRATYRLQLGRRDGLRAGARAAAVPARPRRQPPVPAAVVPGAGGVHARLRRRRPRRVLGGARRRARVRRAGGRRAARRARADPRRRAQPHGDRRRQPLLGRPGAAARGSSTSTSAPAATAASSTSTTWPPCARRTSTSSPRRTGWRCGSRARGRSTACASTIPTGSPTRPATCGGCATAAPQHVWVEKILDPGEPLRDWAVDGTVGYEFLNDVAALFVDPAGEAPLTDLWVEISGDDRPFGEVALEAKLEQVRGPFAPEVDRLRREAPREVGGLERTLASLPVYRTYVEPWSGMVEDADREAIRAAGLPESLAARAAAAASAAGTRSSRASSRRRRRSWPRASRTPRSTATRGCWRSTTSAATRAASGSRSTRSTRANRERAQRFPRNLLVTQTHDTKRSGDVRARIGALAGMPDEWAAHVRRWFEACSPLRGPRRGRALLHLPDAGRRVADRARSGSRRTSRRRCARRSATRTGSSPNTAYEERVKAFCRALYEHRPFLRDFEPFAAEVARAGDRAALGQLLLKLTVPGVPDIYQGDELLVAVARGPRQPPPGRLGAPARAARRGPPRRAAGRPRRASCG